MEDNKKSVKWRNDLILAGIILGLALICFIVFRFSMRDGKYVNVSINGKEEYSFSLYENLEKTVNTEYGENVIVIKDGKVTVSSADCPDKICVEHRAIFKTGETIVCLPHKLVLEIADEG